MKFTFTAVLFALTAIAFAAPTLSMSLLRTLVQALPTKASKSRLRQFDSGTFNPKCTREHCKHSGLREFGVTFPTSGNCVDGAQREAGIPWFWDSAELRALGPGMQFQPKGTYNLENEINV
ncbi:hypothetical protein B0H16DRAFT_1461764 [Mycena metata]|uniref:Uncharacterized protein n=1 Tax=Mycena metata TaxID=1033252 RepID=A0AAD7N6L2_9AGAR|nr:hypothetical protein B0H16DRAFT_1461764 [Mycena metata]